MPVGKPFDLVTALAAPLPVMVIAEMLGVEDGDMAAFKTWSDAIFSNIGDILFAEPSAEAVAASEAMNTYFLNEIETLRASPETIAQPACARGNRRGHLTDEELLNFCRLLLIARKRDHNRPNHRIYKDLSRIARHICSYKSHSGARDQLCRRSAAFLLPI